MPQDEMILFQNYPEVFRKMTAILDRATTTTTAEYDVWSAFRRKSQTTVACHALLGGRQPHCSAVEHAAYLPGAPCEREGRQQGSDKFVHNSVKIWNQNTIIKIRGLNVLIETDYVPEKEMN